MLSRSSGAQPLAPPTVPICSHVSRTALVPIHKLLYTFWKPLWGDVMVIEQVG